MKLKLFKKYFFTTAIIIVFSLTVMMMILSFVLNNYLAKTKYEVLNKSCNEVTEYLSELSEGEINSEDFFKTVNALASVSNVDIFIADNNGKIIICGCDEWMENGECYHSAVTVPKDEL